MKFISWNVNGLRACVQKGFIEYFEAGGRTFRAWRRRSFRRGRLILRRRGIMHIGIMR